MRNQLKINEIKQKAERKDQLQSANGDFPTQEGVDIGETKFPTHESTTRPSQSPLQFCWGMNNHNGFLRDHACICIYATLYWHFQNPQEMKGRRKPAVSIDSDSSICNYMNIKYLVQNSAFLLAHSLNVCFGLMGRSRWGVKCVSSRFWWKRWKRTSCHEKEKIPADYEMDLKNKTTSSSDLLFWECLIGDILGTHFHVLLCYYVWMFPFIHVALCFLEIAFVRWYCLYSMNVMCLVVGLSFLCLHSFSSLFFICCTCDHANMDKWRYFIRSYSQSFFQRSGNFCTFESLFLFGRIPHNILGSNNALIFIFCRHVSSANRTMSPDNPYSGHSACLQEKLL